MSNLNIIVPMAGAGKRFSDNGYTLPKFLIDIDGLPMIERVVKSFNLDGNYIYIVQKLHYEKYNLIDLLNKITPNCKIVIIDGLTEGAAQTVLSCSDLIDNNNPIAICNSDQIVDWDSEDFCTKMITLDIDGGVPTFKGEGNKWSYAKTENGFITEIAEKLPISEDATVGIYYWKHGSDFVKYANQMIEKNIRVNNEFYVAPVYNQAILDSKKFIVYDIKKMWPVGTPEDLNYYLENYK